MKSISRRKFITGLLCTPAVLLSIKEQPEDPFKDDDIGTLYINMGDSPAELPGKWNRLVRIIGDRI